MSRLGSGRLEGQLSQQTIAEKISCTGIGLHSGAPVQMTLHPARAGAGIVFVRTDLSHPVEIPVHHGSVASTNMATTLGRGDATVSTVEHLLSALYSLGIDNVRIEVDGPEVPVMDGSAAPFVFLLRSAGIYDQREVRRQLRIRRTVSVRDGDRTIRIEPDDRLRISYAVDFAHPAIGRQRLDRIEIDADGYEDEISRARTFGFLREVEALWKAGLARGGNLDNTVVMDDERVINPSGLRFRDEFVRHKVLDLLGDISLLGMPIRGHIIAERAGHALHQQLVQAILADGDAWEIEGELAPASEDALPLTTPARASA